MKLDRCKNGHIYDTSRYSDCPYCKSEGLVSEVNEGNINLVEQMNDDEKTVAYWAKEARVDPVVGWLVCIEGVDKGKDFKIISERNFIGRSEEMSISIQGDSTISRKNHCSISYSPKTRTFMITPGQANGLVYVRNEAVYESRELRTFDYIEIGESRFVFVALCGENFDWNIEKNKFDRENNIGLDDVPEIEES